MVCNYCDSQLPDEADICPHCGAKCEASGKPSAKESYSPIPTTGPEMKKGLSFVILIPVVIIIILAIVAIIFLLRGVIENNPIPKKVTTHYDANDNTYNSSNSGEDNTLYLYGSTFFNSNSELYKTDDIDQYDKSGDSSKYIYSLFSDPNIYYITADLEPQIIAEYNGYLRISQSGEYVAYTQFTSDYESKNLYLYSLSSGNTELIDSDVEMFVLSPDGETVVYRKIDDPNNKTYIGGINYKNEVLIDGLYQPISISDDGRMICYIDENENLCVYKDNESHFLSSESFFYWFNNTVTEILYTNNDSTYYFTLEMEEPQKILNSQLYEVKTFQNREFYEKRYLMYCYNCYFLDRDTFQNSVLITASDEVWWLNNATEAVSIGSFDYSLYISEDSSMLYVSDFKVHIMDEIYEELKSRIIFDGAYRVVASKDFSHIYIVDDSNLYYLKENNELEIVYKYKDYISSYYLAYNEKMNKLFFIDNEQLYCVGTDAESLEKVAKNVSHVIKLGDDGITYSVKKGNKYIGYYISDKEAQKIYSY